MTCLLTIIGGAGILALMLAAAWAFVAIWEYLFYG